MRASYGKSFEFVNAQFHLNTSVAPPWGSECGSTRRRAAWTIRSSASGRADEHLPGHLDQQAPFSLNGPFLSLSNDMTPTTVHMWNITVERQFARTWLASAGYVGSRTNNIWESTPLNNALFVHDHRRRAERGEPERAPAVHARGSGERPFYGSRTGMSPMARSATTACCCRFGGSAAAA